MSSDNKLDKTGLAYLWSKMTAYVQQAIEYIPELFIKIGNTQMGTTAQTITGAIKEHTDKIGDTQMGTTATTITGAIAEHEQDISDLNSKIQVNYSYNSTYISAVEGTVWKSGNVVAGTIIFTMKTNLSDNNVQLITGLPIPNVSNQFMIMCVNDYSMSRIQLLATGALRTWYGRNYTSGNSYIINLAYIAG